MASNDEKIRAALALLESAALGAAGKQDMGPRFSELWQRYWNSEARLLSTARDSRRYGRNLCDAFGDRCVLEVTAADADEYRRARETTISPKTRKAPSTTTLNREMATLRRMGNWACEQRPPILPYNPWANIRMDHVDNVRQGRIRNEEELAVLLNASDIWMRAVFLVAFDAGLRRGEIFPLRRDQVHFENGHYVVYLRARQTKNRTARHPRLTERAWRALQELPSTGPYYFSNPETGRRWATSTMDQRRIRAIERSGLVGPGGEKIVLHTMRHSFAYVWRREYKASDRVIQAQGGWKSNRVMRRYGIVDDEELDETLDEVERRIADAQRRRAEARKNKAESTDTDEGAAACAEVLPNDDNQAGGKNRG